MKKLISLLLCTIMLCSVSVFPTSAEDSVMTIEEYEKAYFGEHYITDAEAAAFALAGYPGAAADFVCLPDVVFYIGEITDEKAALLEKYFPGAEYGVVDGFFENLPAGADVLSFGYRFPGQTVDFLPDSYGVLAPEGYPAVDIEMMNTKILYALTQVMKECGDGEVVTTYIEGTPGGWSYPTWHADVNGDGKINAKDILTIKRFMVGIDYRISFTSDPYRDKAINAKDILTIKRYMVRAEEYPAYVWTTDLGYYCKYNPIKGFFSDK